MKKVSKIIKIYISYSKRREEKELVKFSEQLKYSLNNLGIRSEISYYKRGTSYSSDNLQNADIVIFYGGAENSNMNRAVVDHGQYEEALFCYTHIKNTYFIEPEDREAILYEIEDVEALRVTEYKNTGELVYKRWEPLSIEKIFVKLYSSGKIDLKNFSTGITIRHDLRLLLIK